MLSYLILFLLVAVAGWGAWRGRRRSTPESLIRLAVMLLCTILPAMLAPWIARILPVSLYQMVLDLLVVKGEYASYAGFDEILRGFARGLLAPLIFLLLFLLFQGVAAIVLNIVFAVLGRSYRRQDSAGGAGERLPGAIIGGLMSICMCVICFAPLTGTLRSVDHAIETVLDMDGVNIGVPNEQSRQTLRAYAETTGLKVMYAGGGQLLYESTARGYIRGQYFFLDEELSVCMDVLNDLATLTGSMMSGDGVSNEDVERLRELLDRADASPVCRLILLGQVEGQADEWLEQLSDRQGLSVTMPVVEVVVTELQSRTSYDTVCADLCTIVDVIQVCQGLDGKTYEEILIYLGDGGGLDDIDRIIRENPRLEMAAGSLEDAVALCFYRALDAQQYTSPDNYQRLISDLTETLNRSISYSDVRREDTIRNCLQDYSDSMAMHVNDQILQSVTYSIMEAYKDRFTITEKDITSLISGLKK